MDWPADPVERSTGRALADGISPFWYQSEAVEAFLESGHGVVEAPCGAGKTGIGTFLAARLSGRVLVVCHTLELVRQWRDRLATWLPGVTVGQIGGGKKPKEEDIVVASLQTMARWKWGELEAFGRPFQLLICDECHHVPAETWIRVVAALPCRWRLGLTATPKRKDGLETWMHLALGETVYRIDQETLDSSGRTMAPRIHVLRTGRLVRDGRTVLVLTSLVDHAESFAASVGGEALVGRSTTRNREAVLEAVRAGELSVVVATQLADEGLDLPEVDAVVLVAPSSHKPATRQRIGRACRALEGKRTPIVVDVVDSGQWALRKWSARQSLYRSLGWPVGRWA
jgi:superfamily II DNA or RNA helicase